jgi:beta-glucanase (GH16 family)
MKTHVLALLLIAVALRAEGAPDEAPLSPTSTPFVIDGGARGYKLAWSDEFVGNTLDTSKWTYRTDSKSQSTQRPENVAVGDGMLKLLLKKEDFKGKKYTGAGVISARSFEYGYYEARFKVPDGSGWHTSFWTQKYNALDTSPRGVTQELDFCEQDSSSPETFTCGVHDWGGTKKSLGYKRIHTSDLSKDFHIWGCEFTPAAVRFYFDGKLTEELDATAFVNGEQNIWLTSIAYGKARVDETKLPAEADFDYVRYFVKDIANSAK